MKVLFVCSGNAKEGISPIVLNQSQSLEVKGAVIEFFLIKGKGPWSYIKHVWILRKFLKRNNFDIVHSHYSYSSYVAALAGAGPLVVSLMGSDVISDKFSRFFISFFYKHFWTQTIVKSLEMNQRLRLHDVEVIPNGVNINMMGYLSRLECQKILNWNSEKKHILFPADPERSEKNYRLAQLSISLLGNHEKYILHFLKNVPNSDVKIYLNASDTVILCSLHEGSPNVVKEAMACGCPIVTTNVGDVEWVLGETRGCFITNFKPEDITKKIELAIEYREKSIFTAGRDRIIDLGLDSETVASRIVEVYKKVLKKNSSS